MDVKSKERLPGFYWTRSADGWQVWQWVVDSSHRFGAYWYVPGWEVPVKGDDPDEVDERRLQRPE